MATVQLNTQDQYPVQKILDTVNAINGGTADVSIIANVPNVLHLIGALTTTTLSVQARVSLDEGDWVELATESTGDALYSLPDRYNFVRVVRSGVEDVVVMAQYGH